MDRLAFVEGYAMQALKNHGLHDWTFKFNKRTMCCGLCYNDLRQIQLSTHYVTDTDVPVTRVIDTVLHEIAHALAGWEANHGPEWQRIALSIGCSAEVYNTAWSGLKPKYELTCPCGRVRYMRHRRPKKRRACCNECGGLVSLCNKE